MKCGRYTASDGAVRSVVVLDSKMGDVDDADDALIDEETLFRIMEALDVDGDGDVSKEEFMIPWMKLFPKLTRADFDRVWKDIDKDCSGTLSLPELAAYYGFNLSPSAKRAGDQTKDMTDEQIMEALQMSAALQEIAAEKEARQKQKEQEELDAVAAQLAAAQGGRRGGGARRNSAGSDGLRRGSVGAGGPVQVAPAHSLTASSPDAGPATEAPPRFLSLPRT